MPHAALLETLIVVFLYILAVFFGIKVITQTAQPAKALGYLMLLFFLPGIGLLIYLGIGENRRINKIYDRKLWRDIRRYEQVKQRIHKRSLENLAANEKALAPFSNVVHLLLKDTLSPLTLHNEVEILRNGEGKFPAVIKALREARHHIHLEYYIFENGIVGDEIKAILMEKAREGVEVRFVYDDFGSKDIKRRFLRDLRASGVQVYPFYRVRFFANRLNYRNHRKIIVVDGRVGFVGGINISDRYSNAVTGKPSGGRAGHSGPSGLASRSAREKVYWRDTHLQIRGSAVYSLQYLFLSDWSFASGQDVEFHDSFFPRSQVQGQTLVQMASSGPDSLNPTIMMANNAIIHNARRYVYITTPYFIPNESVYDAIRTAALGGLDVRMLVPFHSDSWIVNKAASAYYEDLLNCGVKIYRYQKGFVHAKTIVVDDSLAMVGSANMDNRSFELNFETNALVYDQGVAVQLKEQFLADLDDSDRLDAARWGRRRGFTRFQESVARLLSGIL
ncbi:phospholipase D-like domain-containing protein [Dinghuibacter silviterrae]|uniref:Cardiolipin synthase n=1 Tax=Dinghuibacter silviterrae TaxID=1539049 RepID=A0A4V3GKW6_9BACT|nr:phospholipase D-like domain-containing protein [Dinghuibacter silviterrae]TDW97232.1 cardiolipin synthase [Dinghuibacter silviterrae]